MRKSLTKIEEERKRKQIKGEEDEKLRATGQDSERKAAKWVIEEEKRKEKLLKEQEAKFLEELQEKRRWKASYVRHLLFYIDKLFKDFEWPKGVSYGTWFTGKGIVVAVIDQRKKLHRRGFTVTGEITYDKNAADRFCDWAFDIANLAPFPESMIWTPGKN